MAFLGSFGNPQPTADQQFNPKFMRMWQLAKDEQAKALEKKKKKEVGKLQSKLRDPQSTLTQNQEKLLSQLLRQEQAMEEVEPTIRGQHDFVNY